LVALAGLGPLPAIGDPEISVSLGANFSKADTVPAPDYGSVINDTLSSSSFSGVAPRVSFRIDWSDIASIEAGWSRFGSESGTITLPGAPSPCAPVCPGPDPNPPPGPPVVLTGEHTGQAMWVAYTPKLMVRDWEMRLKLGLARAMRDTDVDPFLMPDLEETTTDRLLGLGVGWRFSERIGANLDVESFGGNAAQAGLSLNYRF
jgi:hypothetical protein